MFIVGLDGTQYKVSHNFKDFTGQVSGRLTVVGIQEKRGKHYIYKCLCSCGKECLVNKRELVAGDTKSCGCLRDETMKDHCQQFSDKYKTHGLAGTKEHRAWKHIKSRVCNPNDSNFEVYSKLGMDETWKNDFLSFFEHIGAVPDSRPRWSVGRIDNTVGYYPGNVRWERDEQQSKNKGKYSNNKSGVTGVYLQTIKGKPHAYAATWYDADNNQRTKYYTLGKYGEDLAFCLACEKRDLEMLRLKAIGIEYGEYHGK